MRALVITVLGATALVALTTGCNPVGKQHAGASPIAGDAVVAPDETITLVGTEPFWGGMIKGEQLTYTTPENQAGETIAVKRFSGNNGVRLQRLAKR